jgi:hypothetical protein
MSNTAILDTPSRTRISFDLRDVLTEEEIAKFEKAAADAKAESLTAHFVAITLNPEKAA